MGKRKVEKMFGTKIILPSNEIPDDKTAVRYLAGCMKTYDGFTQPTEYLRGRWPNMPKEHAKRIEELWRSA